MKNMQQIPASALGLGAPGSVRLGSNVQSVLGLVDEALEETDWPGFSFKNRLVNNGPFEG